MIISDEQVRRAVEYLQTSERESAHADVRFDSSVSPELLARVRESLASTPELRDDRIAHGRELVDGHQPSGSEVAAKMIGRMISDSIR